MELDITIAPDGRLTLHIKGEKGRACADTVELFQRLVGPQAERKWTPEYYEPEENVSRDVRHG